MQERCRGKPWRRFCFWHHPKNGARRSLDRTSLDPVFPANSEFTGNYYDSEAFPALILGNTNLITVGYDEIP